LDVKEPLANPLRFGGPTGPAARFFDIAPLRELKTGQVLFAAGETGNGCYRLYKGLLKVVVTSPNGDERIIAILGPGAVVGELAMIDRLPRSASVVALRDSTLRFVSQEAFDKAVSAHPEAHQALVAILASRLRQADKALAAASFLTVRGRVARALLELAELAGRPSGPRRIVIDDKISHADLAAMAGVARENVSRVLSVWRRRNLVLTGVSPRYCINDITALEREIELDAADCSTSIRR
jgi:CRP/FNR family transcriptional regulator